MHKQKHHFCNKQCMGLWRSKYHVGKYNPLWNHERKKCYYCGKTFFQTKYRIKRAKRHFCCDQCLKKYRKKNSGKYIICDYCGKRIFKLSYNIKNSKNHFCNSKCMGKWRSKNWVGENTPFFKKKKVKCDWCGKINYKHPRHFKLNKHHFCNSQCYGKWRSKNMIRKNNPSWSSVRVKCTYCKTQFFRKRYKFAKFGHHFCNEICYKKWIEVNENKPGWIDGSSFEPYTSEFNNELKEFIRKRDNYICQNKNCGIPQQECRTKLDVHHIDYNKDNCDPINLIALCHLCNARASGDREYWKQYYQKIQIDRKVHELEKL